MTSKLEFCPLYLKCVRKFVRCNTSIVERTEIAYAEDEVMNGECQKTDSRESGRQRKNHVA